MKMKSILLLLIMICSMLALPLVYAQQEILIHYNFEEGTGTNIIDQQNNSNATLNGGTYSGARAVFGIYGLSFNGAGEYFTSNQNITPALNQTILLHFRPQADTGANVIFEHTNIYNASTYHRHLYFDADTNNLVYGYYNTTGNHNTITIPNSSLTLNTYYHLGFSHSHENNELTIWINDNIIYEEIIPNEISFNNQPAPFRVGGHFSMAQELRGSVDEFYILNFKPTTEQVNSLRVNNNITLLELEDNENPPVVNPPVVSSGGGGGRYVPPITTNITDDLVVILTQPVRDIYDVKFIGAIIISLSIFSLLFVTYNKWILKDLRRKIRKRKYILISSVIIALCIGITYLIYLGAL